MTTATIICSSGPKSLLVSDILKLRYLLVAALCQPSCKGLGQDSVVMADQQERLKENRERHVSVSQLCRGE